MEYNIEEYSRLLDDSQKHLSNEAIATYVNLKSFLSKKENRYVENHLSSCEECKERFNHIVAEDREMDIASEEEERAPEKEIEEPVKTFTFERLVKYTIAAVVIIGFGLATYFSFFQEEKIVITEKKKPEPVSDTLRKIAKQDSISIPAVTKAEEENQKDSQNNSNLKSFATNDVLESFVNRNIRSETEIEIVQPNIDDTIKFPYTFKWNQKSFSGSNKLIIVDNQNNPLYQAEIGGKEITIDQKLTSGLYYWKLESNGKLAAVGKFFVYKNQLSQP